MKYLTSILCCLLILAAPLLAEETYTVRLFPTGSGVGTITGSGDSTTYWFDLSNVTYAVITYDVSTLGASTDMDVTYYQTCDNGTRTHNLGIVDTLITGDVTGTIILTRDGVATNSMVTTAGQYIYPNPSDWTELPIVGCKGRLLFNKTAGTAVDSLFVNGYFVTDGPNASLRALPQVR